MLVNVTTRNPAKMNVQLWKDLSVQDKIFETQPVLIKLLKTLLGANQSEGFVYLIERYFSTEDTSQALYDDPELGIPALSASPASPTAEYLWERAIGGDVAFVQAALPTLDTEKRTAIAKLCQAPNSLGLMTVAPTDPTQSRKIFDLLSQVCAHVGQDFGHPQAKNGMSRMANLPQLQFILSNLRERERAKYHDLWKQRELTSASFDYLHKYLGTPSMPPDHLSFIATNSHVLVLEHMINSGEYFPHRFKIEQVREASRVTKDMRILASIAYIATFYGVSVCDRTCREGNVSCLFATRMQDVNSPRILMSGTRSMSWHLQGDPLVNG